MRLTLPLSSARPLIFAAVCARVVMGMHLDLAWLYNAGWISVLIAMLLCLPLGLLATYVTRACRERSILDALRQSSGEALTRGVCCVYCVLSTYETAVTARVLSNSVRHVALSETSALTLLVPLVLVAMLASYFNGQSIGSAARVWVKIVPFLVLIAILIQMKSYRVQWLLPIFGPGLEVIADGAVSASGWLSLSALVWLGADADAQGCDARMPVLGPMLSIGIVSAALLALLAVMSPPSVRADLTRAFQLDKLLSNGRASLSAQLPLIILWYNGLLFGATTGLFLSAKFMQAAFPKLDGRVAILLSGLLTGAIAMLGLAEQHTAVLFSRWLFPAVAVPFFLLLLPPAMRGGKNACKRSS